LADFGRSVAIDGDLVAVGAGGANADSVLGAGAVYLYKRQGLTDICSGGNTGCPGCDHRCGIWQDCRNQG